ncbi:hypothetical protein ACP275_04G168400 [Erythranthe tilingii]
MATYAALVSLINTMDHIQDHPRISNCFDKKQLESLSDLVGFLLDFVEITHSDIGVLSEEDELLESQITSAACAAEDAIESHVVDQIHSGSISFLDLRTVIQDMDYVKDKVVNFKEEGRFKDRQKGPTYSFMHAPPITSSSSGKSKMVGFDEELIQLLDALTGRQSSLQVIPIVGMGGIGKTTLARNLYENRLILDCFDIRAWVTISQEYSVKEIFSTLLSWQSSQSADELGRENEQQLAQRLYQSLIGRRYLIILDDIWSIDVWEKIKFFFPDNNNGSRIILTTRLSNVAVHFGSSSYFSKKFLDEDQSWKLLCEKAFPQEEVCPPKLEKIGMKIAKKCKGLPLLIVVIGGLLSKSSSTQELWEKISKDINSIPNMREEEQSLDILSLSYSRLPAHLKPCFLYMGIFREDREIHVSKIIKLWIAEGFIKPNKYQSLEDVAECYVKDLVDRNLLLVCRLKLNGKIKTCTIHDLLRNLCIKSAQKEKFLYLIGFSESPSGINNPRHILFHRNFAELNCDPLLCHTLESSPLTRSVFGRRDRLPLKFRLLRVTNVVHCRSFDFYEEDSSSSLNDIFEHVNLRYIYKVGLFPRELSLSISKLWNLQTLIIKGKQRFVAPTEIWSMSKLKHLHITKIYLPEPPLRSEENDGVIVLKNLQTLRTVANLKLSEEVCERIPNVKKLTIHYEGLSKSSRCYNNLCSISMLRKLESLTCRFDDPPKSLRTIKFPTWLKKLSLSGRGLLDWEELTAIGSLPNLEVLKLIGSVRGSEWNPVEGEFIRLKYLFISYLLELKHWNADSAHFPVLEKLVLRGLWNLEEIPSGIGEIPTLGLIDLFICSESVAISAMRILEDQQNQGNKDLQVRVEFGEQEEVERFKEKVETFESLKSSLQLRYWD